MPRRAIPEGFPIRLPKEALAGLDGLEPAAAADPGQAPRLDGPSRRRRGRARPLRLSRGAAAKVREEIARAGGREVCFLAAVDEGRVVRDPKAVARGNYDAVLVAARGAPEGGVMLHNHPGGDLTPSEADMRVAAHLYDQGLGTAILDNLAERLYVVVEPPVPREQVPLDVDELGGVLAPGGALAGRYPGYEDRPAQREMLAVVAERFNDGGIAVIEAGTGTGKSLAYLVPAARWAQQNGERTVISTNTINLQQQLTGKDLPLVRELVGDVKWALVKGRGNYVSIRRALLAAESQASLFGDDRAEEMGSLLGWMESTEDGSLADLGFVPSEDTWDEVRSDPDMCLRAKCPYFQRCFYQQSRRRASEASLLVVNHHLLFTDLAVRAATRNYTEAAVLPPYRRVVLDEAHNVEDAATSHLGVEITRRGLFRTLSRLDRRGRGILTALHEAVGSADGGTELRERMDARVRPALSRARAEVEGLLGALAPYVPAEEIAVRLGDRGVGEPSEAPPVGERLEATLGALGRLEREVAELRARLELQEELADDLRGRVLDLRATERRITAAVHGLRLVLAPGEERAAYVRWLEAKGRGRRANLVLAAAPIELGGLLRESLFEPTHTAILTSATLATQRRFDFLRRRLGLEESGLQMVESELDVSEHILLSPFDFTRQTLLGVPTDLPLADRGEDEYQRASARVLVEFAELSDGGLFALFTSHAALRRVAELLRAHGADASWPLFVQGESDRHRLLERFVEAGRGILLGTASFWEGVDVPGHPLRGLVIQKLPFRVPTEPVTAARMEALERAGADPFRSFMLPHAALRLKQGFGRLVRSRSDHGAVLVLDDRLVTKRYGRYLRDSLPDVPLVKGAWVDVRRRLESFYQGAPEATSAPGKGGLGWGGSAP